MAKNVEIIYAITEKSCIYLLIVLDKYTFSRYNVYIVAVYHSSKN